MLSTPYPAKMLGVGTRNSSGWENPCTPDGNTEKLGVFSHSSDIDHHITNEAFSNQLTITTMHKEDSQQRTKVLIVRCTQPFARDGNLGTRIHGVIKLEDKCNPLLKATIFYFFIFFYLMSWIRKRVSK